MTRVLVTGATTPLGQELVGALVDDPSVEHVLAVGIDSLPAELYDPDRLTYVATDLTRSRELRRLLFGAAADLHIQSVVHTALHRCAADSGRRIHALNVDCTRELLHLIERHPTIERFVYRSFAEVYRVSAEGPTLVGEEDPLELSPAAPQRVRDRVEADMLVCARIGLSPIQILVLRCAPLLCPASGSQLWDYLQSAICLRPLGYDPMINLLTVEDAVSAIRLALTCRAHGVFNIPGADALPLSKLVRKWGRRDVPAPGPLLAPLYRLRARATGRDFRYELERDRMHFSAILDGEKAQRELGYAPAHPIPWPERPIARTARRRRSRGSPSRCTDRSGSP